MENWKIPRSVAAVWASNMVIAVALVVFATWYVSREEYWYSWQFPEERDFPEVVELHFQWHSKCGVLIGIAVTWSLWLMRKPYLGLIEVVTFTGVLFNLSLFWVLWTAASIYVANHVHILRLY